MHKSICEISSILNLSDFCEAQLGDGETFSSPTKGLTDATADATNTVWRNSAVSIRLAHVLNRIEIDFLNNFNAVYTCSQALTAIWRIETSRMTIKRAFMTDKNEAVNGLSEENVFTSNA